jgi:anti-sigma B factor antagonist
LEFKKEIDNPVVILTAIPAAKEARDSPLAEVRRVVSGLVAVGGIHIVLDLAQVEFMNTTDIGAILGCMRQLQGLNGTLVLCGIGPRLAETLSIIRVNEVLPFRMAREDAVSEAKRAARDVSKDPNKMRKLAGSNPTLADVRSWWDGNWSQDSRVVGGDRQEELPGDKPEVPDVVSERPPAPQGVSGAGFEKARLENELAKELIPDIRDWIRALEVFREARSLWTARGLEFSADITFKEFVSRFAETLISRS